MVLDIENPDAAFNIWGCVGVKCLPTGRWTDGPRQRGEGAGHLQVTKERHHYTSILASCLAMVINVLMWQKNGVVAWCTQYFACWLMQFND